MRTAGITAPATTCDRGIPLPTTARGTGTHPLDRPARDHLASSPFRGKPIVEFTPEQLQAAGYHIPGKTKKATKGPKTAKVKTPRPPRTPRPPKEAKPPKYDRDAVITDYVTGGLTVRQVADRHGIAHSTVSGILHDAGVTIATARSRPRKFDHEAAVAEYVAGDTTRDVAQRHGVSEVSILAAVRAAGHPVRTHKTLATIDEDAVKHLYTVERLTPAAIGKRIGFSDTAVRRCLIRNGVPLRDDRTTSTTIRENTTAIRDLLAANSATADQVRAWATTVGRDCATRGVPPRALVEDYLLNRAPRTTDRKAAPA